MKHLQITLPSNRVHAGFFTLVDEEGVLIMAGRALGKASNKQAAKAGNKSRDSTLPYGDTPTGEYEPASIVKIDPPHPRLGDMWIPLIGRTGDALTASTTGGRTGLGIHAGQVHTDGYLMPTLGCVRQSHRDLNQLWQLIADERINITIYEED